MGVAPVDGYGNITSGNAKEIYTKYKKGEVDLSPAQQKYCENFLTPEEIDEVSYDTDVKNKEGKDKIGDAEKAESHGGQGANAAATSGGMVGGAAGVAGGLMFASEANKKAQDAKKASMSVWSGILAGAIIVASGALCIISANKFDAGYKDRTGACDRANDTNATIDGYTNALIDTMDLMNEDMDAYTKLSQDYTLTVNTNTSQLASLQVDLAAAQAAGDKAGVESIKAQMKQIEGMDLSGQTDEMDETKGRLDEYNAANSESQGVSSAGQSVSDFLKEGTGLGVMATVNAVLLTVATVFCGIGATKVGTAAKMPWEFPVGIAAAILYGIGAALLGTSAGIMASKAAKEYKCGSAGGDMQGHVDGLNDMIEQQAGYVESTTENFDSTDEASTESQAEAQEKGNKAVATKGALPTTPKKDDKDDDKDGGGSPVSAGAAA